MSDNDTPKKRGWFGRLKSGLARSSNKLTQGIGAIFTGRKLDDEMVEELEELLITADLGPATAARMTAEVTEGRYGKDVTSEEIKTALAEKVTDILLPVARAIDIDGMAVRGAKPVVLLMVGVNGAGKTTTIGKLANQWAASGRKVTLAAGDTFRAAAIEQLKVWGDRAGVPVVAKEQGADPAGLAYDALEQARAQGRDILMIDTAGRLQNKTNLMEELNKIVRVIRKIDPTAPHATLLVLDATTGQNAKNQVEVFKDLADISGLLVTKLDGSAKGGVIVGLAEQFRIPIHAVGVGEGIDDLKPFDASDFARSLMGLDR